TRGVPGAKPLMMHAGKEGEARIDKDETVGGAERVDVGQCRHEDRVGRDLDVGAGRAQWIHQWMSVFDRDLTGPQLLGKIQDAVRHHSPAERREGNDTVIRSSRTSGWPAPS